MRRSLPRPALLAAMLVGAGLRVLPLVLWFVDQCQRDECTYKRIAAGLLAGRGLETEAGWLWAPGYPALIAGSLWLFGQAHPLRYAQVALAVLAIGMIDRLARRVSDERAGTIAAWAYALHPTLVFFAGTLWSEAVYGPLLLGAVLSLLWAREGGWRRAALPGVLIAGCVLFRGVAQYMAPIFALGLLLPAHAEGWRDAARARWRHAAAMLVAVVLGVAPYSAYATRTYGGFVLSDATLGQMMWYGNNDFPPISFDWGSGLLADRGFESWTSRGRGHCDLKLPPAAWNACEVAAGRAWIEEHPLEFVRRVPVRVAQLLSPHTFLTRHVRLGKWPGLPYEIKEGLALWVVAWSFVVIVPGTVAAAARARGPFGVLAVTVVAYHVAAVAVTAGLTRYRIPLEPLWLVWIAGAASRPRETWAALSGPRGVVAAAFVGLLLPLWAWYLRAGFPGFDGQ